MKQTNLTELREQLFDVLTRLKEGNDPEADPKDCIDIDRAKAISEVSGVIIDSAKVELSAIKALKSINDEAAEKYIKNSQLLGDGKYNDGYDD